MSKKKETFLASLKAAFPLTKPGSTKDTHHLVIDLKGANFDYQVGDSIGVLPSNSPDLAERTAQAFGFSPDEILEEKNEKKSLFDLLKHNYVITKPTKKLLREVAARQTSPEKKEKLEELLKKENKEACELFLASCDVCELLEDNPEVTFELIEIPQFLQPLLPRFYSIASSKKQVGDEVHFTIANVAYEVDGKQRRGICTRFLLEEVKKGEPMIPLYLQPAPHFRLPDDPKTPIIMVGPGTGIAPFRAFLQERIATPNCGPNWLFFGDRTRKNDFLYEEELLNYQKEGKLELDLAFSRDQEEKVYVQDRMWEKGKEIWSWLEKGACFYLCGDAKRMAKDVETTLVKIIEAFGGYSYDDAKSYFKQMRKEKRFSKDVY